MFENQPTNVTERIAEYENPLQISRMSVQDYGDNMLNMSYHQSILNSSVNQKKESLVKNKVAQIIKMRKQYYSKTDKKPLVIDAPEEAKKKADRAAMLKKFPPWFEDKKDVLKHFGIDVDYIPEPVIQKKNLHQEFTEKMAEGNFKVDGALQKSYQHDNRKKFDLFTKDDYNPQLQLILGKMHLGRNRQVKTALDWQDSSYNDFDSHTRARSALETQSSVYSTFSRTVHMPDFQRQ